MEIPRFIVYNPRQVGHKLKKKIERGSGGWENEEEEGLRVRCEFVGGANGSAALTATKSNELGADRPPCSSGVLLVLLVLSVLPVDLTPARERGKDGLRVRRQR